MNPKAKAENLIEKFIANTKIWNDEQKVWEDCIESAKRCALITVDEIISTYTNKDKTYYLLPEEVGYWKEVEKELLKIK